MEGCRTLSSLINTSPGLSWAIGQFRVLQWRLTLNDSSPSCVTSFLKRDNVDVLIPYVGPLYISMPVSERCIGLWKHPARVKYGWISSKMPPPLTKHPKVRPDFVSIWAQFYLFLFVCFSVCASISVCLSPVCIVELLLVSSQFDGEFLSTIGHN